MARNKKPQEMTELIISNDQFRNSEGMVEAGLASNAHKFFAEMKLVAEATLSAGEKLLVGAREVNKATGAFTQAMYVPKDKADLITRNINVRRDSYRNRDDLEKKVVDLQNAEIVTGRRDVVMAERRYDYESANARRLGIRDIHAAGGLADKAKYRDLEHPYATAMYLPFDLADYASRSGRARAGWVQSQFNSAMSGESRNERSFAREQHARAEAERQRKEDERNAREAQRNAEKQARAEEQAQKARQRAEEKQQKERERQQKAAEREEERRRKEESKAEEKSNRERLVLFTKIGVMLATVVALIRGITTSLLGGQSRAAGSSQSRLPEGFDLSTPILDGFKQAFSKIPLLNLFSPLVDAITETVQKIRVQTLEGLQSGLSAAEVRLYDTNDVAHQLAAGTTVGAMKGLTQRAANIITLANENNLGDDYAKMILGNRGLLTMLTDYSMGKGGHTTAGVFEALIDAYFSQFLSGKNVLGHTVEPELLMQELKSSIASLMGDDAAAVLGNMMLNSMDGSWYTPYNNFEGWMSSTRLMQLMQQGAFEIPKEQLDYANVLSKRLSETEAMLQAVFDKFLMGMQGWLDDFLDAVEGVAYWFMDDADKARVNAANRAKNSAEVTRFTTAEAEARASAATALGMSQDALLKTVTLNDDNGTITAIIRDKYSSAWNDEQIARYMQWVQLYETLAQAKADVATGKGRVHYRGALYTPEGQAYGMSGKVSAFLHQGTAKGFPSDVSIKNGVPVITTGKDIDDEVLGLFLSNLGFTGADIYSQIDALFTGATHAGKFSDYSSANNPQNLTDFIDQIMLDFGEKLSGEDFTQAEISAFYERWKVLKSPAERLEAAKLALDKVTSKDTKGLKYGGSVYDAYVQWLQEALALREARRLESIMGLDISGEASSPVYTARTELDTSDTTGKAMKVFKGWLLRQNNLIEKQELTYPGGKKVTVGQYTDKDITGFEPVERVDERTVRFRLDLTPELARLLKLTWSEDNAEAYVDINATDNTVEMRAK